MYFSGTYYKNYNELLNPSDARHIFYSSFSENFKSKVFINKTKMTSSHEILEYNRNKEFYYNNK